MASETEQLAHDFEQVRTQLAQYPQIHVVKTEGDPPATYEVEYRLQGLTRQTNGNVDQTGQHLLRISLPFGYPHFPPTVKPLTHLFHPDIDPDAVRITSYWQKNPSLAGLLLHIGEMICAKDYNLKEPFNQEAADWYSEHSSEFPLDEIKQGEPDESDFEIQGLSLEEDQDLTHGLEIDVPEAGDQEQEDDFDLDLQIDNTEESPDDQLEEIEHHINKNEIVTAEKLLRSFSSSSPEAKRLEKIVFTALAKRDKLFKELEELENEDRFTEAYKIYEKIKSIAIDTPALSDIGKRLQQSQAMLDAFSQPTSTEGDKQDPLATNNASAAPKKKKKPAKVPAENQEKASIKREKNRPIIIPIKPILFGLAVVALGTGTSFFYSNNMDKMIETERKWVEIKYQRCSTPDQFKQKRVQAEQLLVILKSIYLPGLGQKALETEIHNHINSPHFKKGEKGEIEYKGAPFPAEVIKHLEPIDQKMNQATHAAQTEQFTQALALYNEALTLAESTKVSALDPHAEKINTELEKRIEIIHKKTAVIQKLAGEKEQTKERQAAERSYKEAFDFCQDLRAKGGGASVESDNVVTGDLWGECVTRLQEAEKLLNEYPTNDLLEWQDKIKTSLAYSQLYQELEMARQAYEEGEFITAVNEYQRALRLLEENRSALSAIYNDAILKVGKTIVMLNVSLQLQKAVEAENQNDLKRSLGHYKEVLRIIRSSQVNKDDNLNKLEQYVRSKIKEQGLEAAKSSNQEWWQKNYERIFNKEFPSSRNALLSKPRIRFIKVQNGRLLYTIQCTEKKGVTIVLELNYQYDMTTGRWSPYRGEL